MRKVFASGGSDVRSSSGGDVSSAWVTCVTCSELRHDGHARARLSLETPMPRPLIGITTYLEAARWGTWVREAAISPQGYAIAVLKSGGVPVLVPPFSPSAARDYMRGLDGLVLAGGVEVDPSLYGEAP